MLVTPNCQDIYIPNLIHEKQRKPCCAWGLNRALGSPWRGSCDSCPWAVTATAQPTEQSVTKRQLQLPAGSACAVPVTCAGSARSGGTAWSIPGGSEAARPLRRLQGKSRAPGAALRSRASGSRRDIARWRQKLENRVGASWEFAQGCGSGFGRTLRG